MIDYNENTVGWWLSQLKEPLRSMAISEMSDEFVDEPAGRMLEAVAPLMNGIERGQFWEGAYFFFCGDSKDGLTHRVMEGWVMAKECAPDAADSQKTGFKKGEATTIVGMQFTHQSGEKTIEMRDEPVSSDYPPKAAPPASQGFTKMFFYAGALTMIQNPLGGEVRINPPTRENGMASVCIPNGDVKAFMDANTGILFFAWDATFAPLPEVVKSEALGDDQSLVMSEIGLELVVIPPVEGYTPPPRCVTDSEKIEALENRVKELEALERRVTKLMEIVIGLQSSVLALKDRVKELEGIVITLARLENNRAPINMPPWVEKFGEGGNDGSK